MIIEKRGILEPGEHRFECLNCGTIFTCKENEYKYEKLSPYLPGCYIVSCPLCDRKCSKSEAY